MNKPEYGDTDSVAAFATPLGISALTVIRTTGGNSVELLSRVFSRPERLRSAGGNTVVHGWITACSPGDGDTSEGFPAGILPAEKLDEVLVSVYRGPASYTGEDGADISCHGGIAAAKAVMAALKAAGFREALPGEFTFRAFMNGKLDLTRCESVMEIVSAKTNLGREHAVRRLSGGLEKEIREINSLLIETLAAAELCLDYSEDEAGEARANGDTVTGEAAGILPDRHLAEEALERLRDLISSYRRERLYAEGALAVIAGRPNAGKSSVFNLLLGEDRSIVTDVPGTTRDWIEDWVSLEGIPVRLTDTAGLRDSEDPVEKLGIGRSRTLLGEADLVLYLVDGSVGITGEDRAFIDSAQKPLIPIWNKADLAPPPPGASLLAVSAKTGAGFGELTRAVVAALEKAAAAAPEGGRPSAGIGTARQKELSDTALASLEEALALADRGEPLDLVAPLLREAVNALGEITGETAAADILEVMFSRFCVGK
ncbi:MAG: tRNA uridine-5-carboxymethylaminomethyl(34) synthesis GTPase MnmE [Treponema sp.]|jgi:tRNA modification GTPase|nr:tRNA uridine-5-carboxymethylaminomethyl(34) synthesis GTPase MnmE [Treponema sp.]